MLYAATNVVHTGRWVEGLPHGRGERRNRASGAVLRGEFVPAVQLGLVGGGLEGSAAAVLHGARALTRVARLPRPHDARKPTRRPLAAASIRIVAAAVRSETPF